MSVSVTIACASGDELVAWAHELLKREGFAVSRLHVKETPTQLAHRLGIHPQTLSRKLRLRNCPQNFQHDRGQLGRFNWIMASPELEEFLRDPQSKEEKTHG